MPILDIELVVNDGDPPSPEDAARQIADAAGRIFMQPSGECWVRLRTLPRECYAENGGGPPADIRPVFVTVLKGRTPGKSQLQEEIASLTRAVAEICNRPEENIHVLYEPNALGRIAFGGRLADD